MWPPRRRSRQVNWRFWIPTVTAVLALVVSAANAYFTFARHVDRLSIMLKDTPVAFRNENAKLFLRANDITITFVNSGNRPVVIYDLNAWLIQSSKMSSNDCERQGYAAWTHNRSGWNTGYERDNHY